MFFVSWKSKYYSVQQILFTNLKSPKNWKTSLCTIHVYSEHMILQATNHIEKQTAGISLYKGLGKELIHSCIHLEFHWELSYNFG